MKLKNLKTEKLNMKLKNLNLKEEEEILRNILSNPRPSKMFMVNHIFEFLIQHKYTCDYFYTCYYSYQS